MSWQNLWFSAIFQRIRIIIQKLFFPLIVSGWVKPFIIKLLCLPFLYEKNDRKHPTDPVRSMFKQQITPKQNQKKNQVASSFYVPLNINIFFFKDWVWDEGHKDWMVTDGWSFKTPLLVDLFLLVCLQTFVVFWRREVKISNTDVFCYTAQTALGKVLVELYWFTLQSRALPILINR